MAALVPYKGDNFRLMEGLGLRDDLDRFIPALKMPALSKNKAFMPFVDVWDDRKNVYLETDMPGMEPKGIKVSIKGDNMLVVSAHNESKKEQKKKNYFRSERYQGDFYRELSLPANVSGAKARAVYRNGILQVVMPKKEDGKKLKNVAVKVTG